MQNTQQKTGTLYVVATPIGNLNDMTLRAIEVLKTVDKIAAEDTRHAGVLLKHFSIQTPTISLHQVNERDRFAQLIGELQQGKSIALISDAGTPLISDPGYHLVKQAHAAGVKVVAIPGACAAIAALSVAGLATNAFMFEGFLSAKTEVCHHHLLSLRDETRTMIFYEAPHRLLATLKLMVQVFGPSRPAVVARELTKIYETVWSYDLATMLNMFHTHPEQLRGEIVILVAGNQEKKQLTKEMKSEEVLDVLLKELPLKQAVSIASELTGERKNLLYAMGLAKKK